MGSAIQPDQRNSEFFRHVATKRRSSSAMLDQTLLGKESPSQFFCMSDSDRGEVDVVEGKVLDLG